MQLTARVAHLSDDRVGQGMDSSISNFTAEHCGNLFSSTKDSKDSKALTKLAKPERLDLTIVKYNKALSAFKNSVDTQKKRLEVAKIAKYYDIVPSTLGRRIAGQTRSHPEAHEYEPRLTSATPCTASTASLLMSWKIEGRMEV